MTTLQNFIDFFDIFGMKPQMYYLNKKRYTSLVGAITSIVAFVIIGALVIFFFASFLLHAGMTVVFSKDKNQKNNTFAIGQNLFMIRLHELQGGPIDPRIATIKALQWEYDREDTVVVPQPLELCSYESTISRDKYKDLIGGRNISHYHCLAKSNNATLSMLNNNLSGSYLYFYAVKCNNETDNGICLPQNEIDAYLKNITLYVSMFYESISIDHYNDLTPITPSLVLASQLISTSFNYDISLNWKAVEYYSDVGWLFPSFKNQKHFEFDETNTRVLMHITPERYYLKGSFSSIKLMLNPYSVDLYHRSYPKIQTIIANLGGLLKVVMITGEVFVGLIINGKYFVDLLKSNNHLFNNTSHSTAKTNCFNIHNINKSIHKIQSLDSLKCNNIHNKNIMINESSRRNSRNSRNSHTNRVLPKSSPISSFNVFQWRLCPNLNPHTRYIALCESKICTALSVENILLKLYSLDKISETNDGLKDINNINNNCIVSSPQSMKVNKKRVPIQQSLFYQSIDMLNN